MDQEHGAERLSANPWPFQLELCSGRTSEPGEQYAAFFFFFFTGQELVEQEWKVLEILKTLWVNSLVLSCS